MSNKWKFKCNSECITPLQNMFFSNKNIKNIKKKINEFIFKKTGHKIAEQSDKTIVSIMYNIYDSHKYYNSKLKEQLNELNNELIFYVTNNIIINMKQYIGYIKKISRIGPILDYGISTRGNDSNNYLNLDNSSHIYNPLDSNYLNYYPI